MVEYSRSVRTGARNQASWTLLAVAGPPESLVEGGK